MDFDEFLRLNGVKDVDLSKAMQSKHNSEDGSDANEGGIIIIQFIFNQSIYYSICLNFLQL